MAWAFVEWAVGTLNLWVYSRNPYRGRYISLAIAIGCYVYAFTLVSK